MGKKRKKKKTGTRPCFCRQCDIRRQGTLGGLNTKRCKGLGPGGVALKSVPASTPSRRKLLEDLGGEKAFGVDYNLLLHTTDMKYRLSRAHFYQTQFVVARTGECTTLKEDARAKVPLALIWTKRWVDDGKLLERVDAAASAAAVRPDTRGAKEVMAMAAKVNRDDGGAAVELKEALGEMEDTYEEEAGSFDDSVGTADGTMTIKSEIDTTIDMSDGRSGGDRGGGGGAAAKVSSSRRRKPQSHALTRTRTRARTQKALESYDSTYSGGRAASDGSVTDEDGVDDVEGSIYECMFDCGFEGPSKQLVETHELSCTSTGPPLPPSTQPDATNAGWLPEGGVKFEANFTNMDMTMATAICTTCWQHCVETGGTTPCGYTRYPPMIPGVSSEAAWTMSAGVAVGNLPPGMATPSASYQQPPGITTPSASYQPIPTYVLRSNQKNSLSSRVVI